jgi:hypothetical protein
MKNEEINRYLSLFTRLDIVSQTMLEVVQHRRFA